MHVDTDGLPAAEAYRLMIACLVPRPIAWASTLGPNERPNLAPFSYFGGVSSTPPIVVVSVGRTRGRRKDTATNLIATRETVIHVPTRPLAEAMVASSAGTPPDADPRSLDDFARLGLAKVRGDRVRPWRIAEAKVAFECVVLQHHEVGEGPTDVFFLRVLRVHVADDVLAGGLPDPARLRAVGRLGGESYAEVDDPFRIPRP